MKKLLLAALALAVVALAPSKSVTTDEAEFHLHKHAEAAAVTWQCRNCGQRSWLRQGTLPASYGCDGDLTKRHVWERLD